MTPLTLRHTRRALGLTQAQAALLVGVEARTWRSWEAGVRAIPEPVARLVWLVESMSAVRDALDWLAAAPAGPGDTLSAHPSASHEAFPTDSAA